VNLQKFIAVLLKLWLLIQMRGVSFVIANDFKKEKRMEKEKQKRRTHRETQTKRSPLSVKKKNAIAIRPFSPCLDP
jgi:Na+-transporting methylmalonyl-CoA/oxaloacetate decarboxylase gamma subunit